MNNNQPVPLTSEEVRQNYYKKQRASAMSQMNMNNSKRMQAAQQSDSALVNLCKTIGDKGGLPMLKKLHVVLTSYIQMAEFNGGKDEQ